MKRLSRNFGMWSWENYDNLIRVSNRNREHPTQSYYLGFRCVAQPSR